MSSINATATPAGFTLVATPGPRMQDAVIAAAAEMALADGEANPVEHRSLLAFLKQNKMLLAFGRTATINRFAAEIDRARKRHASNPLPRHDQSDAASPREAANPRDAAHPWQDLTARLRPLAGMEAARVVAAAAAHVAAADGEVHSREIELLDAVHATLGLTEARRDARA